MTSDLHARLHDLATDAPAPAAGGTGDLWRAGKRRQRRRTAAGALAACALVAVAAGGVATLLPTGDMGSEPPASPRMELALPDELHRPSRWATSNDDDPAGPFAVLLQPSEGLGWRGQLGYVGVSAETGEYRAVVLPRETADDGLSEDVLLSPGGRYIAYWGLVDPEAPEDEPAANQAVELFVYDTVTGTDLGKGWQLGDPVDQPHGLAAWDLRWLDDSRVYVQAGAILGAPGSEDANGSRAPGQGWVIDVAGDGPAEPVEVPGAVRSGDVVASDGRGQLLLNAKGRRGYLLGDPATPEKMRRIQMKSPGGGSGSPYVASADGRVAVAALTEKGSRPFLAVTSPDGTARSFRDVKAWNVFGWSDASHVVAYVATRGDNQVPEIVEVDVSTGEVTPFIGTPEGHLNLPQLASGLLDTPPAERPAPDDPVDPRALLAGAAAVLLAGYLAVRTWRRRVRG